MIGVTVTEIVIVAGVLLLIGSGLVSSLLLLPGKREVARETFRAMLSMVVVAATVLLVFWGQAYTIVPFMLLLAFRTTFEATEVLLGRRLSLRFGIGAALVAAVAMLSPKFVLALAGLWLLILGRQVSVRGPDTDTPRKIAALFLYPILPMAILASAALDPQLRPVVLIVYVLVELFDSCAFASGKFFGRTQAFPVLSPRKTVEGLIGGAICLMIISAATAALMGLSVPYAALLALLAGMFGVAGDLAASRLKRAGKVKDFPVVVKMQGGALDVFDSWISAGAAIAFLVLLKDMM